MWKKSLHKIQCLCRFPTRCWLLSLLLLYAYLPSVNFLKSIFLSLKSEASWNHSQPWDSHNIFFATIHIQTCHSCSYCHHFELCVILIVHVLHLIAILHSFKKLHSDSALKWNESFTQKCLEMKQAEHKYEASICHWRNGALWSTASPTFLAD